MLCDFTKAFDHVNRDALVFKLKKRFVNGKFLSVIKSMFNKSDGRVKWRNKFSKPIKSKFGVLQGGVLSPKLFTLTGQITPKPSTKLFDNLISPTLMNGSEILCNGREQNDF